MTALVKHAPLPAADDENATRRCTVPASIVPYTLQLFELTHSQLRFDPKTGLLWLFRRIAP
jgi:hypothetical protein